MIAPRTSRRVLIGSLLLPLALASISIPARAADVKPLRVLLITGGCCHDYGRQKDVLKSGLEARAHVVVDQIHSDDKSTKPPLAILGNPDYAKGYDLVIHDECAADVSDPATVEAVLKPHRDGVPAVALHCAMHSYRIGNPSEPGELGTPHNYWFEFLGIQSSRHGPQEPISISYTSPEQPFAKSPITLNLENWTTIREELYNNVRLFPAIVPVAWGSQAVKRRDGTQVTENAVVAWTNTYGAKKTRVFSTTIGHNTDTVADPRYLDLVTRGLLWAAGRLTETGKPASGYGPGGK